MFNFFNLDRIDQKTKTDAAKLLLEVIKYNKNIKLSNLQIEALIEPNSQLRKIIEKHLELLPAKIYQTLERAMELQGKSNSP